jgi:hypothetical protein
VANEEATLELALLWQIYLRCVFAQIHVSAVRATLRWQSSYELGDYVTHGWQASLRRRSVVNLTIGHFAVAVSGEEPMRHAAGSNFSLAIRSASRKVCNRRFAVAPSSW